MISDGYGDPILKFICNVNIFSVGFDAPNIDGVFIQTTLMNILLIYGK